MPKRWKDRSPAILQELCGKSTLSRSKHHFRSCITEEREAGLNRKQLPSLGIAVKGLSQPCPRALQSSELARQLPPFTFPKDTHTHTRRKSHKDAKQREPHGKLHGTTSFRDSISTPGNSLRADGGRTDVCRPPPAKAHNPWRGAQGYAARCYKSIHAITRCHFLRRFGTRVFIIVTAEFTIRSLRLVSWSRLCLCFRYREAQSSISEKSEK